jgi:hypothetical protein
MGPWTYYSPLWLGTIIAGVVGYNALDQLPPMATWLLWLVFVVGSVLVGVQCQLVMIAAQGIFAQVLPVPRGRSIRGRGARFGGSLLLGWVAFGSVAGVLWLERVRVMPSVLAVVSLVCLAGAVVTYAWCWPTAVRDFDKRAG